MGNARFVAGDWGTTHLRLFLTDAEGVVLERRDGPGAVEAGGRFAAVFAAQTAGWEAQHGTLPAVLCGMVGSSIGWVEAPYVPCPVQPDRIAGACVAIHGAGRASAARPQIHIVPGLSCRNRFGAPDVLRGEETQLLGLLSLLEPLRAGTQLVCLPGTHTKWVVVEDGRIHDFFTAPTGELFGVLSEHSLLVRKPQAVGAVSPGTAPGSGGAAGNIEINAEAFGKGVATVVEQPHVALLHRLFECRSRPLSGELPAAAAAAYLSGLLISSDVLGALRALSGNFAPRSVVLVGALQLTQLYATACRALGIEAREVDGVTAALAGLTQIYRRLLF